MPTTSLRLSFLLLGSWALLALTMAPASANGWDTSFHLNGTDRSPTTAEIFDGDLVIAGEFTTVGPVLVDHVAMYDGTQWSAMGDGLQGDVFDLVVFESSLIACGDFELPGGQCGHVARWDGEVWQPLGNGLETSVRSLEIYRDELWCEGSRWTGTEWVEELEIDGVVNGMAVHDDALVFVGDIAAVDGQNAGHVFAWRDGVVDSTYSYRDHEILEVVGWDGTLVILGRDIEHYTIDHAPIMRHVAGQWEEVGDLTAEMGWSPYDISWHGYKGLLVHEGELLASEFDSNGTTRLIRFDGDDWVPFMQELGSASVDVLVFYDDAFILGGSFFDLHGSSTDRLARFDGLTVSPLTTRGRGSNRANLSISGTNEDLIVGPATYDVRPYRSLRGGMWDVVDFPASLVRPRCTPLSSWGHDGARLCSYRWTYEHWYEPDEIGTAIAIQDGDDLIPLDVGVAEVVDYLDMTPDVYLATEDGVLRLVNSTHVDTLALATGGGVKALARDGHLVLAAGDFTELDGDPVHTVAAFDGTSWTTYGDHLAGDVEHLVEWNGTVVAIGNLKAGGAGRITAAAILENGSWRAMGPRIWGAITDAIHYNGSLIISGWSNMGIDGKSLRGIARWDGDGWRTLGGGVDGNVKDLHVADDRLWLVGDFERAGGHPAFNIVSWRDDVIAIEIDPDVPEEPTPGSPLIAGTHPNPFNPTVSIRLGAVRSGSLSVDILDVQGRVVRSLYERTGGNHPLVQVWNGRDDHGRAAASGVYLVRVRTDERVESVKILMFK